MTAKDPNRFIRVTDYVSGVENGVRKEYRPDGSLWITTEYKERETLRHRALLYS